MTPFQVTARVGDKDIILETGKVAKQAHGSIWARMGESIVLITVVSAAEKKEGIDFFPLTVDYQEKLYAAGRIPGSYFKREGRLTERETLTSRIIDRSCRPLFPDGYANETQIIATVVSFDQENDPDVLALTGASAALQCSDVPFAGPFAGVRVGRVNGQFVANPTLAQRAEADLDVIMAASRDAITMVEGGAREVSEKDMIDALLFGHAAVQPLLDAQLELHKLSGSTQKKAFDAAQVGRGAQGQGQGAHLGQGQGGLRPPREARPLRPALRDQEGAARGPEGGGRRRRRQAGLDRPAREGDQGLLRGREVRVHAQDDHRRGQAHRRPRHGRHPPDLVRGGAAAPRPRLGPLHPRRDPGPGGRHPRHRHRRSAHRGADRHDLQAVHAPLQLPALLGGRGQVPARPRAAARSATACWPSGPSRRSSPRTPTGPT